MILEDHRLRVARLLRGERRVTDLHILFSDLRMSQFGRASVQEIGHFAAHRHERDTGISLARANDIQTSARLWQLQFTGTMPNAAHLKEAGRANLKIMPDVRIKERLGISRQTAEQSFNKAIRKYELDRPLKERESQVLCLFGLQMMWQSAFNDSTLWQDFVDLLLDEKSLAKEDRQHFEPVSTFVSLYALNIMHGARMKLADGKMAQLRLSKSEEGGHLRVKANIPVSDMPKPVNISVPMFERSLMADDHCDSKLLDKLGDPIPAEIEADRLVALV